MDTNEEVKKPPGESEGLTPFEREYLKMRLEEEKFPEDFSEHHLKAPAPALNTH